MAGKQFIPSKQSAPAPVGKTPAKSGAGGLPKQGSPAPKFSAPNPVGKTPSKGSAGK